MIPATVLTLPRQPISCRSSMIRSEPYRLRRRWSKVVTSVVNARWRARRSDVSPPRHLYSHACETPNARHDVAYGTP